MQNWTFSSSRVSTVQDWGRSKRLQEKPAAKLTSGIVSRAILQAAIETKNISRPACEEAFRRYALDAVNGLPWDIVQDDIKGTYAVSRVYTQSVALAAVKTDLDPAVQKIGSARQPTSLATYLYAR